MSCCLNHWCPIGLICNDRSNFVWLQKPCMNYCRGICPSIHLFFCLDVTPWHCIKMAQVRITKSVPSALVIAIPIPGSRLFFANPESWDCRHSSSRILGLQNLAKIVLFRVVITEIKIFATWWIKYFICAIVLFHAVHCNLYFTVTVCDFHSLQFKYTFCRGLYYILFVK